MPTTIKSICDEIKAGLVKQQDFETAATVREIGRTLDPKGNKKLTDNQARNTRAFLNIIAKRAYT